MGVMVVFLRTVITTLSAGCSLSYSFLLKNLRKLRKLDKKCDNFVYTYIHFESKPLKTLTTAVNDRQAPISDLELPSSQLQ